MNRPGRRFYLFDRFRVDVNERLLFKDNREVPLTPKVFDTLLVLLENSSHVMTKKELMQQVWPDSFVELPGNDHLPFVGDQDAILDEVEEFLTGVRHTIEPDTVLATVLVARLVGIKERVQSLGPERWPDWWRRLHAHITKEIEWFRGREVDILENRLLAIFDGPARAVRCGAAITEYTSRLGVQTCT